MGRNLRFIVVMVTFLSLILMGASTPVIAASTASELAAGAWSGGTSVDIDLQTYPAPMDWYQLLTRGVKITAPGKICHEFRGGQFKWIADVRQLVNGKWVKVPTTQGWLNGEEAPYTVCAQAPAAGTYALFGFYSGPPENETAPAPALGCPIGTFDEVRFESNYDTDWFSQILVTASGLIGQTLEITILDMTSLDPSPQPDGWSNTEVVQQNGIAYFERYISNARISQIHFILKTSTCSQEFTLNSKAQK